MERRVTVLRVRKFNAEKAPKAPSLSPDCDGATNKKSVWPQSGSADAEHYAAGSRALQRGRGWL